MPAKETEHLPEVASLIWALRQSRIAFVRSMENKIGLEHCFALLGPDIWPYVKSSKGLANVEA